MKLRGVSQLFQPTPCKRFCNHITSQFFLYPCNFYTISRSSSFSLKSIYIDFTDTPIYHLKLFIPHEEITLLSFDSVISSFVSHIIIYLPLSLLILHNNMLHFLISITTSIAFVTLFRIILLLMKKEQRIS